MLDGSYEADSAFSLVGLPPSSNWALVGPYIDDSLVRNAWTYNISNQMGRWAPGLRPSLRLGLAKLSKAPWQHAKLAPLSGCLPQ